MSKLPKDIEQRFDEKFVKKQDLLNTSEDNKIIYGVEPRVGDVKQFIAEELMINSLRCGNECIQALATQKREMVEVVDEVAKQFDAVRVNSGITNWAFPKHPHTQLRARENYEIAKVLKAFDEALKALSSKKEEL